MIRSIVPRLFDLAYALLLIAAAPALLWRVLRHRKYVDALRQRLGFIAHLPPTNGCIWVHGVSVGEVKTARPLVDRLRRERPSAPVVVSATSRNGKRLAQDLYPDCHVIWFPLDFSWAVRRYLRHFDPAIVVLMELELWPNFLAQAQRRGVPIVLVNGRLSERSYRGYARYLRRLFPWMTRGVRCFAMQSQSYAERLERLGIESRRIAVTGSMKFDVAPPSDPAAARALADACGVTPNQRVLIAGSTHPTEEKSIIDAYLAVRPSAPDLRLILVPRQPARAAEVCEVVRRASALVPLLGGDALRAGTRPALRSDEVIVWDTMGQLGRLYALASIAIIGGSLAPDGGHNFIEPAALGKPVVCGPSMFHFPEVRSFIDEGAIVRLRSVDCLAEVLLQLLRDPASAEAIGRKAAELVERSQGSTDRNVLLCLNHLPSPPTPRAPVYQDGMIGAPA